MEQKRVALKSDYFRIEICELWVKDKCYIVLKSDYFRIEISATNGNVISLVLLKIRLF